MYLVTHTSTSRWRRVAESFAEWETEGGGLLFEIQAETFSACKIDVSWVSKFPGEEETLFAGNSHKFHVVSVKDVPSDKPDAPNQHIVLEDENRHIARESTWKTFADVEKYAMESMEQGVMESEDFYELLGRAKRAGYT